MKYILCVFIFAFVHFEQILCKLYKFNENLDHYLNKQLALEDFYEITHNIHKKDTEEFITEYSQVLPISLQNSEIENINTFKMFNTTFIFGGREFFFLNKENNYSIEHLKLSLKMKTIDFLRTITFGDLGYLIVGSSEYNEIQCYTMNRNNLNELKHLQTIETSPIDAHLFINQNNLYLAVLNKDNGGTLKIYEYQSFYFDEIANVLLSNPKKISSFSDETSEIIIILSDQKTLTVFEFNLDTLRKIEKLFIENPTYLTSYYFKDMKFVIVGNSTFTKVYYWNDYYLVDWFGSYENLLPGKYDIFYNNTRPTLINTRNDTILAYCPQDNKIELLNNKEYKSNLTKILDIEHKEVYENGSTAFTIVGLYVNNTININVMTFKIDSSEMESHLQEENDVLHQCFINLEQKLYTNHKKLNNLTQDMKTILLQNETNPLTKTVPPKLFARNANANPTTYENIKEIMNGYSRIVNGLKSTIDLLQNNSFAIKHNITVNGLMKARSLIVRNMVMNSLNNHKWKPEEWLLYSLPQIVTGRAVIENLNAIYIHFSKEFFSSVLLKNSPQQVLTGNVHVKNLTMAKLYVNEVNGIKFDDIYLKDKPTIITGLKHFEHLHCNEIKAETFNNNEAGDILSHFTNSNKSNIKFASNVFIDNLNVKKINNVSWDEFQRSVYRIGVTESIKGNLTFANLKTKHLNLKTLENIDVDKLFTTSTDQIITSDIEFRHIFTKDITANTVNGIRLKEQAALLNTTQIKGPVKMDRLNIKNNLKIIGDFDKTLLIKDGDHVIGTNESDLLQIYNKKVTIKGNLHINNLLLQPDVKMRIKDEIFSYNIPDEYWTKSTNQEIPVHFEAQNGISASHLTTTQINGIKVSNFMLNNNEPKPSTNYYFENATVLGNVILNKNKAHTPDLEKIEKEAVKTTGSFIIYGKKIYNDTLRAKNFITNKLEGINVLNALTSKFSTNVTGKKIFKNLIVKGHANVNSSTINVINNINLNKLMEDTLFIDRLEVVDELNLSNMITNNINAVVINKVNVKKHISQMENLYGGNIENLYITGNVTINNIHNVLSLNNINITKTLSNDVKLTQFGTIKGDMNFVGTTKIENLQVNFINGIDFENLTSRILYKNINQQISANYTFTKLKTNNIYVDTINNKNMRNLIDVNEKDEQELYAPNGVKFLSPVKMHSVYANHINPCDLNESYMKFRYQDVRQLNRIQVNGNVTFLDEEYGLGRLFKDAVTLNKFNIISAPVKLRSFSAQEMYSNKLLNEVKVQELFDDALLTDSPEEQIVTGFNNFSGLFANMVEVKGNTNIPKVNNNFVLDLNNSIVDKNSVNNVVIKGKKTFFAGIQTKKFWSKIVSNVDPNEIVTTESLKSIPNAIFDSLTVLNDVNISFINNIDFNYILNNRLLCHSSEKQTVTGTHFYENINILNNLQTGFINNINVSEIVFDVDKQVIRSSKKFASGLVIDGNIQLDILNEVNITEKHLNAVLKGHTTNFENSLTVLRPAKIDGNIETETLNGYSIALIKDILGQGASKAEAKIIHEITNHIDFSVQKSLPLVQTIQPEYMYIEKSLMLQISFPNTTNAKILTTRHGHVLLHIIGEEDGHICGLPNDCICPVQHTIEISTENSINDFLNKGYQRIFSYSDDDMTVHFITNSVSTDASCRTNSTAVGFEESHITWTTMTTPKQVGSFFIYGQPINGYISGVEYFTVNGNTYLVYGKYYDPIVNTHKLHSVVMKFSPDKSALEEIQQIPTEFLWTMHSFESPYGIEMIFGKVRTNPTDEIDTTIYRFDIHSEKFVILDKIQSTGCTSAVGIVLGEDSFIGIANKYDPMYDLKLYRYSRHLNGYYYYQSIRFDSPVVSTTVFYIGDYGTSDAYLSIVNGYNNFYIYSYNYLEGWKLESNGQIDGLNSLIPFSLNNKQYIFASSSNSSSLLTVVKYGVN